MAMTGRQMSENKIFERADKIAAELPDYAQSWYLNRKASRKTAASCYEYIRNIKEFLASVNHGDSSTARTEQITETSVTKFYLSRQKKADGTETSDSYQQCTWSQLNSFLSYLKKHGKIPYNYMDDIDRPSNHDLERINANRPYLTVEDFDKMLGAVDGWRQAKVRSKRDKAILMTFMNTGMRNTALTTILIDDIDWNNNILRIVDKGSKPHEYIINAKTMDALREWLEIRHEYANKGTDNHLFISDRGTPIAPGTVANLVKKYSGAGINKRLSPHKLRAGVATIVNEKVKDLNTTREYMGHADTSTTQRYVKPKPNLKREISMMLNEAI